MFVDTEKHPGGVEKACRRLLAVAGLAAVVAAGVVVAAPAAAQPAGGYATVFTHSAGSGLLKDGRLTLRGVSGRVTYATNAGRSGVTSVRTLHRLIRPGKPATGTLHVAGHRGGDEPAFRLSRPRYNRSRRTVSYRVKPLNDHGLPRRGARRAGAARRFGAASLSIVPHPQLMGGTSGGAVCYTSLENDTDQTFQVIDATLRGRTQRWTDLGPQYPSPDPAARSVYGSQTDDNTSAWETDGNAPGDGCSNTVTWAFVLDGYYGPAITISTSRDWGGSINASCLSLDRAYTCSGGDGSGQARWTISGG